MNVGEKFFEAQEALFEHVGFAPDWVEYAIDNQMHCFWSEDGKSVKYAETMKKFNSDGDYYIDQIYTQRFYDKWVYEGKDVTMIFCNPGVDGINWFRIFDSKKKVKDNVKNKRK